MERDFARNSLSCLHIRDLQASFLAEPFLDRAFRVLSSLLLQLTVPQRLAIMAYERSSFPDFWREHCASREHTGG
jgi:hypothetical protein